MNRIIPSPIWKMDFNRPKGHRNRFIVSAFHNFIQTLTPVLLRALTEKFAVHSIAGIGKNRTQRITAYAQIS